jgi:hypothetical protein
MFKLPSSFFSRQTLLSKACIHKHVLIFFGKTLDCQYEPLPTKHQLTCSSPAYFYYETLVLSFLAAIPWPACPPCCIYQLGIIMFVCMYVCLDTHSHHQTVLAVSSAMSYWVLEDQQICIVQVAIHWVHRKVFLRKKMEEVP